MSDHPNVYVVSYSYEEGHDDIYLTHKRAFRRHEWNRMFVECAVDAMAEYYVDTKPRVDRYNAQPYTKYLMTALVSFVDGYSRCADLLCERYGFERLPIRFESELYGSGSKLDPMRDGYSRLDKRVGRLLRDRCGTHSLSKCRRKEVAA